MAALTHALLAATMLAAAGAQAYTPGSVPMPAIDGAAAGFQARRLAPNRAPAGWVKKPSTFCQNVGNDTLTWGVPFAGCLASCVATKCSDFAFTNERWTGRTGCSLQYDGCAQPCNNAAEPACGNWDTYTCALPGDACTAPAPPPAPRPPTVAFKLSPALGDHMVLQRDTAARVWGTAPAGSTIKMALAGPMPEQQEATASATGEWAIDLKPRPATTEPSTLVFTQGSLGLSLNLTDVLFGETTLPSPPPHTY